MLGNTDAIPKERDNTLSELCQNPRRSIAPLLFERFNLSKFIQ